MADLDALLDDALNEFDDEPSVRPAQEAAAPSDQVSLVPQVLGQVGGAKTAAAASSAAEQVAAGAAAPPPPPPSAAAAADSQEEPSAAPAAGTAKPKAKSMTFDPLGSRKRGSKAGPGPGKAAGLTAAQAGASSSSSGSGSGSSKPQLPGEVAALQEELGKLIAEWSQAMNPDAPMPNADLAEPSSSSAIPAGLGGAGLGTSSTGSGAGGSGSSSSNAASVLRALAEQTERTVAADGLGPQASSRGSGGRGTAGGGAAGGAGEGQQMNMIVDVVMQHLLSKDVLFQPMKEIADKYPPWLEKARAGSSSSVTPEALARYEQQYRCICNLLQVYEEDPSDFQKIMGLLQEMQSCGEPPQDIVDDMSRAIAADIPTLTGARFPPAAQGSSGSSGSSAGAGLAAGDPARMDALMAELLGQGGGGDGPELADLLGDLPGDMKGCPVQ